MRILFEVDLGHNDADRLREGFLDPFASFVEDYELAELIHDHDLEDNEAAYVVLHEFGDPDGEGKANVYFFSDGTAVFSEGGFRDKTAAQVSWSEAARLLVRAASELGQQVIRRAEDYIQSGLAALQVELGPEFVA